MTIDEIMAALSAIVDGAQGRNLTDDEVTRYEDLEQQLAAAQATAQVRARQTAYESPVRDNISASVDASGNGPERRNPLAYTPQAIAELQDAVRRRAAANVDADLQFTNATLTTGTYGAPREWGSNTVAGPRMLHVVAGIPTQPADAIFAQFPQLTLPAATAASAEGVTLTEYASATAGSVTLGRFGRWTDLSAESQIGTDAGAIVGMHAVAIAKDLDKILIDAVETAAGGAVAFSADVPAAVRTAMARVLDNTAASSVDDLVILVHPDNAALLQDVSPTGGETMGEPFQRFSGGLVYPSSAVNTGFCTVANLRAGARYFEAEGLKTVSDTAVKTSVVTLATALIAGYALGLVGGAAGFAIMVDVVTP